MESEMKLSRSEQGKKSRADGQEFQRKVRLDLEESGWIVIKNPNNIIDNQFKLGKPKFNPFTKTFMMVSQGFPDFIIYKRTSPAENEFIINGVEVKMTGVLDRTEKDKCNLLLDKGVFNKILIAKKIKIGNKNKILYDEYKKS
jgi:hypothetical protein